MYDFVKTEKEILKFWEENKIFEKLREKNRGKKRWSFLDGPITANNPMGVHHAWGRTYKDLFQRYKAMQGFDERFQNGFDCQGLWVEVEVEKELGFATKKDIEKYGIDKFIEKCKERVRKYSKIQTEQSIRLGQWMDWPNSYYTMSEENNYAIWSFLKKCYLKGYLYKGRDVVAWCPRCGTAISQHEILEGGYQEITHQAIFFKLPLLDRKNTFFLVWTTTPWTLPANVAVAVHPELIYAEVETDGGNYILLKDKVDLIGGKILKTFRGKELEGLKYQGLFDELPAVRENIKDGYPVVMWDEIVVEEGTGIVHIAPGCGAEDFQLGKEKWLPVIDPTNEESRYKTPFGFLSGKLVTEVNNLIFENLKKKERVFKIEDYKHNYPICWRCDSQLIFRLVNEWYISMDKIRRPLIESAKKVDWLPSFGLDREIDWLNNMRDWLISKKRYWGLALPIYECFSCGYFTVVGSKEELKEKAVEGWDEFEAHSPHRPWIDKVKIKCPKCGKVISRILDVGNPWLDAGMVPFSTMGYFKDKNFWKKWFPAELVCECFPGQFRNWFYAILAMSQVLENRPPVKTIFGHALVFDEKGEEMHKSKGNAIWFDEAVEKIGADVMRWMFSKQNPVFDLRFGYKVAQEHRGKLLNLLNIYTFLKTYVSQDDLVKLKTDFLPANILDKWVISRLNNLILKATECLDKYDVMESSLRIEKFFYDDVSLWYLRRSRSRIHGEDKEAAQTLYLILLALLKLIAPFTPFLAEEMFLSLRTEKMSASIHLENWPKANKKLIDAELEAKMSLVRKICELGHSLRSKTGIKVRQPLGKLKIKKQKGPSGESLKATAKIEEELFDLIKNELNVKEVELVGQIEEKPRRQKVEAPIPTNMSGGRQDVGPEASEENWVKISEGEIELSLDTRITSELKAEGLTRELTRQINDLRKEAHLTVRDSVRLYFKTESKELKDLIENFKEEIKEKTISQEIREGEAKNPSIKKQIEIDNKKIELSLSK